MSQDMYDRVAYRFHASWVKRWHTRPSLVPETLGQHSHTVAMLVSQVYPGCSKALLLAALEHDLPEFDTGDIPAPAKWGCQFLQDAADRLERAAALEYGLELGQSLVQHERLLLKWADMAALILYAVQEVRMGNSTMWPTVQRCYPVLLDRSGELSALSESVPTVHNSSIAVNVVTFMSQLKKGISDVYAPNT